MYLDVLIYDNPEKNMTDQIQVPVELWEKFTTNDTPTFMRVNGSAVGRIVPAEIQGCRIPSWMWSLIGEPTEFVELEQVTLPTATLISLKPRDNEVTSIEDMTAALSQSWACLSVGAELPLICGTYDIVSIEVDGNEVPSACILNCDVNLDLIGPDPSPGQGQEPELEPSVDFNQMISIPTSKPELFPGKGRRLGS
jgi:hypothetical protein